MKNQGAIWWGTFHFNEDQPRYWEIGALLLGIERQTHEWRIASNVSADNEKNSLTIGSEANPGFTKDILQLKRFIFHHTNSSLTLTPILADRTQVAQADTAFYLPPQEHVTLYVSSPVWVRLEVGTAHNSLLELPSLRQSDTWYGPNTAEGELCYASRTFCRTDITKMPLRSHRVITPIIIYNHTHAPWLIAQLSLPLPYLSLFVDSHGALWTEEIIIKNELDHHHSIKQGKGAPHIAPDATLLTPPRLPAKSSNFISLFYSLLME